MACFQQHSSNHLLGLDTTPLRQPPGAPLLILSLTYHLPCCFSLLPPGHPTHAQPAGQQHTGQQQRRLRRVSSKLHRRQQQHTAGDPQQLPVPAPYQQATHQLPYRRKRRPGWRPLSQQKLSMLVEGLERVTWRVWQLSSLLWGFPRRLRQAGSSCGWLLMV